MSARYRPMAVFLFLFIVGPCLSQPSEEGVLTLPGAKKHQATLAQALQHLDKNEWNRGLSLLQHVLSQPDFFVTLGTSSRAVSAHWEANQQLTRLGPEGRKVYEKLFGAHAAKLLEIADKSKDLSTYEQISKLFLHTEAGEKATQALVIRYLQSDQKDLAELYMQRLLTRTAPASDAPSFESLLVGGNSARNAKSPEVQVALGDELWRHSVIASKGVKELIRKELEYLDKQKFHYLPPYRPLMIHLPNKGASYDSLVIGRTSNTRFR